MQIKITDTYQNSGNKDQNRVVELMQKKSLGKDLQNLKQIRMTNLKL